MADGGHALHAHTYSTSMQTFNNVSGLRDEMIVTQSDIWHDVKNQSGFQTADVEFIAAMEHKTYPLFTSMYHPEYQLLEFTGDKKWTIVGDETTDEIAFRFSLKLNRLARLNSNQVRPGFEDLFDIQLATSRTPSSSYPMVDNIAVYAYGYDMHPEVISATIM